MCEKYLNSEKESQKDERYKLGRVESSAVSSNPNGNLIILQRIWLGIQKDLASLVRNN